MKFSNSFIFSLLLVVAFLLTTSLNLFGQEKQISKKEVPSAVLKSFKKEYPKAHIKGLSTETEKGKSYFEIESIDGKVRRDLLYTPEGKVAEIEETITTSELPKESIESIQKKIPGGKIEKAERVTSGSKVTYELRVAGKKAIYEVVLDSTGKVVKAEKINKENDENDEDND